MFGLETKSLIVGLAVGYFVLPRIVGPIMGKVAEAKNAATKAA